MKWKYRPRPVDPNGFQNRWIKSRKFLKRNRKDSEFRCNFVHFQRRFPLMGEYPDDWEENNNRLDAALKRIPRMHSEYHRRKR